MSRIILPAVSLLLAVLVPCQAVWASFVLTVDPATGQVQLKLDSPLNVSIDGYSVLSNSGSLTPATWNSLQDQNVAGWEQAPPAPSANAVSELKADGSLRFQNTTGFALGQLFKTVGATQDLRLEYFLPENDFATMGTVVYGPITPVPPPSVGLPGDFNEDGSVDAADYVFWRKNDGTQTGYNTWRQNVGRTAGAGNGAGLIPGDVNDNGVADINDYIIIRNNFLGMGKTRAQGDLTGGGIVNVADFRQWKNNRTAGAGADTDALPRELNQSVPEPASLALMLLGTGVLTICGRRRSASRPA